MLIDKLKLNYFGCFHNREIELKPGINLIYGENESGKTTIHNFIRGMLFGVERLKGRASALREDIYAKYLPWDYPGAFGGSMDIRIGEKTYRLQRSFHAADKSFTVTELSTGREVKLKEGLISELIPGLTESAYLNTGSVGQQRVRTDTELALQVRNYIANLSVAKSQEVDVGKAVSILNDKRRQLENALKPALLEELRKEIKEGLAREEETDRLAVKLRELLSEEQNIRKEKEIWEGSKENSTVRNIEQFPAIIEKFRSYQELIRQENGLEEQIRELKIRITALEQEEPALNDGKKDFKEAEKLQNELTEFNQQELELQKERDLLENSVKRNLFISLLPCAMIAVTAMGVMRFRLSGILTAIIFILAGMSGYALLSRRCRRKLKLTNAKVTGLSLQKAAVLSELEDIFKKNRITGMDEFTGKQLKLQENSFVQEHLKEQLRELEKRRAEAEDNRDLIYDSIMKYMLHFILEEELSKDSMQRLQEEIQRLRLKATEQMSEINRRYENCKMSIEKIRWELSALEGNEEQLLKNQERYKELESSQKETSMELEAVRLALASIQELSVDIHDSFGQDLNRAVSSILSEVTGQKYTDLKVDERLEIKVGWNDDYIQPERLSAGTIDQIYLALRLAVSDLLLGSEEIPLILDDSFAFYDDNRVKAALQNISRRGQILLFTCHKREQGILEELGIKYHLIDLSGRS